MHMDTTFAHRQQWKNIDELAEWAQDAAVELDRLYAEQGRWVAKVEALRKELGR